MAEMLMLLLLKVKLHFKYLLLKKIIYIRWVILLDCLTPTIEKITCCIECVIFIKLIEMPFFTKKIFFKTVADFFYVEWLAELNFPLHIWTIQWQVGNIQVGLTLEAVQ